MSENFKSYNSERTINELDDESIETLTFISKLREKIANEGVDWIWKAKRELTDEEISSLLHGFDKKIMFTKNYFDQINIPDSENELLQHPEDLINLRKKYTQFIVDNLAIGVAGLTTEQKKDLSDKKAVYVKSLDANDRDYESCIKGEKKAMYFDNLLYQAPSLKVSDNEGYIYTNIKFQDSFIHWRSNEYARHRLGGDVPKLQYRIYLNPDSRNIVDVFQKVIDEASANSLLMTCKVQDRALELSDEYRRPNRIGMIRGDGIVVYLENKNDVQNMLNYLLQMYQDNPNFFINRKTNKIPQPIVPGISLGDEPGIQGQSLTSHRVNFLEEVAQITRERTKTETVNGIEEFRRNLKDKASDYNINPNNIAFNLTN